MANGKKCHSDAMCLSGFCNGSNNGGICEARKTLGQACPTTDDTQCVEPYQCGKKSYWDSTCENPILSVGSFMNESASLNFDVFLPSHIRCVLYPNFCTSRMDN